MLLLPIITQYLTDVDFGISGTISAYTSAISVFSTLGFGVILQNSFFKNPDNYALISPNLFRVQTMSKCMYGKNIIRDYMFRHHLESIVTHNIKDVTYCQFKTLSFVRDVVKVRVNHIGQIVSIGEY